MDKTKEPLDERTTLTVSGLDRMISQAVEVMGSDKVVIVDIRRMTSFSHSTALADTLRQSFDRLSRSGCVAVVLRLPEVRSFNPIRLLCASMAIGKSFTVSVADLRDQARPGSGQADPKSAAAADQTGRQSKRAADNPVRLKETDLLNESRGKASYLTISLRETVGNEQMRSLFETALKLLKSSRDVRVLLINLSGNLMGPPMIKDGAESILLDSLKALKAAGILNVVWLAPATSDDRFSMLTSSVISRCTANSLSPKAFKEEVDAVSEIREIYLRT